MWGNGLQGFREAMRGTCALALVWLVLALFVAQTAATRSHFHVGTPDSGLALADAGLEAKAAGGAEKPLPTHDESHCPLLHAAGVCGAVALPSAVVLIAAPVPRLRIAVDARLIFPERFAAAWRSRAPPSV